MKQRKTTSNNFFINILLLLTGIMMVISGLTLQLGYHFGGSHENHGGEHEIHSQTIQYEQQRGIDMKKNIWGLNYSNWSKLHKYVIVFFSLFMIYHLYIHWKWYKVIIIKKLMGKNFQVISLSVLFFIVAVTGLVPWFIDLSGSKSNLRMLFIELHDKIALILIIYLVLHIVKRSKWFVVTFKKLRKSDI